MRIYKESELRRYAAPISDTEDQRCQRAIHMVRDALKNLGWQSAGLVRRVQENTSNWVLSMNQRQRDGTQRQITIFVQGSYANKTNIPSESDVDVAVILENALGKFYRKDGVTWFHEPQKDALILLRFKKEVLSALQTKFSSGVTPGNKSIKVKGNEYRVDADVVPCGRTQGLLWNGATWVSVVGVRIQANDGASVINYPEQHIKNGLAKNRRTDTHFKKCVRILKSIRCDMEEADIKSAKETGSFLIESLLWNVPDNMFRNQDSLRVRMARVLGWLVANRNDIWSFTEINGIKQIGDDDSSRILTCSYFIVDLEQFYHYEIAES